MSCKVKYRFRLALVECLAHRAIVPHFGFDQLNIILEVLNSLEPGQVSDPVLMPRAVMGLKLREREVAHVVELEEARRSMELMATEVWPRVTEACG